MRSMNVNVYNVIWADDEYATLSEDKTIRECLNGKRIEVLKFVPTSESLRDALEEYCDKVDAVIIDGNFSKEDVPYIDGSDISGLIHTISFIETFNAKRDIPFYLYTGRKDMLEGMCKNGELAYFKNNRRMFQKGYITDLADTIVHDIDHIHSIEFNVRKQNQGFLNLVGEALGEKEEDRLYQFLLDEQRDITQNRAIDMFTDLRKILEEIVGKCIKDAITPEYVSTLNIFSYFYSFGADFNDKRCPYITLPNVMHPAQCKTLINLVSLLQDGSHSLKNLNLHVSDYVYETQRPFVFRSCLYQVMDLVRWYKETVEKLGSGELRPPLYKLRSK
jgi:hypothetical protein